MAYQIHIIPREDLQTADTWKFVVDECEGVRLASGEGSVVVNPKTGEEIRIGGSSTDAEIHFPDEDAWYPALFWRRGRASINARFEMGDETDPAWRVVSWLAQRLDGEIQGDEGEVFDRVTGQMVRDHLGRDV